MADTDLMTLGFGFNSAKANSGISSLEAALGKLEAKHTAIKKSFEEGFNFNSSSFSDFSVIVNSISQNSKNLSNVASSFKSIAATIPKLSGEKLSPISDETVARMQEFSLAGTAAGNSVRQMVGKEFVTQMTVARQEMGKLNSALLHVAKSGRAVREALAGIPGMLNRLSGEKVKVITPEAIESMRQYGNEVRAAATEIKNLQGFTGQIRKSATGVSTFQAASSGAASSVRSLGGELLNIATMSSLPMFFRNAAKEAVSFGAELAQIESITLNFSADKLREGLLALPSAFGDARKNANALYYAYSSGVEGSEKELVDFTAQMAKLSQVIRANQTDTVNAVTSAFNAYNLSVKNAAEVSDVFYGIVKRGKAEGNELASSLGQVIPTAATAGVNLNELGASVTSLTKVMNTRNAITYLNNMLSKLIKPTKESRLEAKKLGIELGLDALQAKGFSGMMQELREKTLGNREALLRIFPDLRGQRAALQLLNKGWGDFQSQLQFFNNKAGITDLAFEKLNHSIEYQLSILPQTFGKIRIAAGEVMTSILTLGGALEPLLRMFNNMSPAGQKVVGALTLMGAVYGLLKAKTALFNAVQGVEVRHQQVLSALRSREVAERTAVTAAVARETAAKSKLAKAQAANALVGRNGFGGGFAAGRGVKGKSMSIDGIVKGTLGAVGITSMSRDAIKVIRVFRTSMFALGKTLGVALKAITAVFSGLNLVIAGLAAIAIGFVDYAIAGFDVKKTTIVSKVGEWLYDFFTGGLKEAKRLESLLNNIQDAKLKVKHMDSFGSELTAAFIVASKNSESFVTQQQTLEQNYKNALDRLNSSDMSKNYAEWRKAKKNLDEFSKMSAFFDENAAVKRINARTGSDIYLDPEARRKQKQAYDVQKSYFSDRDKKNAAAFVELEKERDAFNKRADRYNELKKAAEEAESKITPALEAFRRNGESFISFFVRQRELFGSIEAAVEAQRFAMMKPAEQMKKQEEYISEYKKTLQTAIANGNAEQALGAVKNVMSTYTKMIQGLERSAKQMKQFAENLANDSMESLLKSFDSPTKKMLLLNQRAYELWQESGFSWTKGIQSGIDNGQLEKSYSNAKKSIELQIRALQIEIDNRKKLADAEKRANENTVKLISSMDRFKATASEAVEAQSIDALKLQSRRYEAIPSISMPISAQAGLQGAQAQEKALYEKMSQLAEIFKQTAQSRQTQAEGQKGIYEQELTAFMAEQNQNAARLEKKIVDEIEKIIKEGKQIQERLGKLAENGEKTAVNTGRSAAAISQISTVTIG